MAYIAYFYDRKENRFFHVRYLYYTKKEIRAKAKIEYPNCELTSIDEMDGWLQYGKHNINGHSNTSFTNKRLIKTASLIGGLYYAYKTRSLCRVGTYTTLWFTYSVGTFSLLYVVV